MTVQEIRELIGKKTEEINGYLESRDADKAEAALEEKRRLQRLLAVREAEDDEEKEELRGQKRKKEEKRTASAVSELRVAVKFALKGKEALTDEERAAVTIDNNAAILPEQFVNDIQVLREGFPSLKEHCHIVRATSNHGKMPFAKIGGKKLTKYKSGTKLTGEAANTQDISYNIENYGALVPIANDLQEDEAVNIIQDVIKPDFAEAGVNSENDEILQIVEDNATDKSTGVTDWRGVKKVIDGVLPTLRAKTVVLAIGVTPDTVLAKEAGLELGIKESIVVNDRMETSVPDIYAAGDAVQVKHYVTGNDALISLAGPANKQGRIIADNICGGDSRYLGSQGSSVIKVFDMTAATTGINETNAKKSGLEVDTVILSPMSHAGYYPGGKVMTMKVVFEKESYRLLGAQIIGYEGVDKRIDVLATAIHAGLNATQLKDLDLAYAPPYSSAKDPVNMAGFMIDNIAKGTLKQWHLEDMDKISKDKDVVLLDVRTVGEFSRGHIDGFKNIPVDELRERISEIEKGKPVYLICQSGLRSYIASRILEGNGYETYNFSGGFRFYDAVVNDRALIERAYACGMDY